MSIDPARRNVCKAAGAALALAALPLSPARAGSNDDGAIAEGSEAPTLWYRRPATRWVEALPLGNGRLGAMVWGGIGHERLQLNDDTFYAGGPYDADNPEAALLDAAAHGRRGVRPGRNEEAKLGHAEGS